MSGTKDIKRRIQSIGNITQITNAMKLVASAKLRKSRNKLDSIRPYVDTVVENIAEILSSTIEKSKLMEKRKIKNRAIILVSSDKGLAGGYNINVVNEAFKIFKNDGVNNTIYTTGNKSVDLLKRKGLGANTEFAAIYEEPEMDDASKIGTFFVEKFLNHDYDEVVIVYTKFKSVLSFVPSVKTILPVGISTSTRQHSDYSENNSKDKIEYDYEPSVAVVLSQMIKQYINVSIYGCLMHSAVSEQASRRTAMENATSNGEDMLEDLQLEYNRARQAAITQEISEIVGGAEALK